MAARAQTLGVPDRTRRRVIARHFSPVAAPEQQVPDGDGGLHISAPRGMCPGDGGVGLARVTRRNVACRLGSHRPDRLIPAVPAGQVDQPVGKDGRRHRHVAPALQVPQALAGRKVITPAGTPAIDGDLFAARGFHHRGGAPGRHILPCRPPDLLPIRQFKGRKKRVGQHVTQHNHLALRDNR